MVTPPEECDRDPLLPGCTPEEPVFPGLTAPLEIIRDDSGVVHVEGETDADVYYGSGYMQAFDRLLQMELVRRRALGTRAEVLGARFADDDELVRRVDIARWGATNAAALLREDPAQFALLVAWCAGVNARIREIAEGVAPMPPELSELGIMPREWTPADAMAAGKLIVFGNANQLEFDLLSSIIAPYLPELDARLPLLRPVRDAYTLPETERPELMRGARPPFPAAFAPPALPEDARERMAAFTRRMALIRSGGSNNWAVEGRLTDTGRPYVAGDPHQGFSSPSLFWLHHMRARAGALDVIGFSFVGTPSVQLGHNAHIAWTATTTYPDMMDIWSVGVTYEGSEVSHVSIGGEQVATRLRRETIAVLGEAPREIVVEEVPGYGVLLPTGLSPLPIGLPGNRLLFNWTGFRVTHEAGGFHAMDLATNLEEFEAAADRIELGCFNFLAADASGIAYRSSPLVPARTITAGFRPYSLLDGSDASTFWTGAYLSAAQLPHSRGAARGWIATANNDPLGFTADGSIEGDPWYFGVYYDPGTRAARIESELTRLSAEGPITRASMEALQDDSHSLFADDFITPLLALWDATATDDPSLGSFRSRADLETLIETLRPWDRRMERAESAPVIYQAYAFLLTRAVLSDDLGVVFQPIMDSSGVYMLKWASLVIRGEFEGSEYFLPEGGLPLAMFSALDQTATWLSERFGGVDPSGYTWGDYHSARFPSVYGERLEGGSVPTDGGDGTVNVADTGFFDGNEPADQLFAGGGAIYRIVAGFDEDGTPRATFQMVRGVSGDPASPHWSDLHDDWVEHRHRPLLFRAADISAVMSERMTITP